MAWHGRPPDVDSLSCCTAALALNGTRSLTSPTISASHGVLFATSPTRLGASLFASRTSAQQQRSRATLSPPVDAHVSSVLRRLQPAPIPLRRALLAARHVTAGAASPPILHGRIYLYGPAERRASALASPCKSLGPPSASSSQQCDATWQPSAPASAAAVPAPTATCVASSSPSAPFCTVLWAAPSTATPRHASAQRRALERKESGHDVSALFCPLPHLHQHARPQAHSHAHSFTQQQIPDLSIPISPTIDRDAKPRKTSVYVFLARSLARFTASITSFVRSLIRFVNVASFHARHLGYTPLTHQLLALVSTPHCRSYFHILSVSLSLQSLATSCRCNQRYSRFTATTTATPPPVSYPAPEQVVVRSR